jgi:succinyl-CoA synthetase beta subunit
MQRRREVTDLGKLPICYDFCKYEVRTVAVHLKSSFERSVLTDSTKASIEIEELVQNNDQTVIRSSITSLYFTMATIMTETQFPLFITISQLKKLQGITITSFTLHEQSD